MVEATQTGCEKTWRTNSASARDSQFAYQRARSPQSVSISTRYKVVGNIWIHWKNVERADHSC